MGTLAILQFTDDPLTRPLGVIQRRDRPLSELGQQFVNMLTNEAEFGVNRESVAKPQPVQTPA